MFISEQTKLLRNISHNNLNTKINFNYDQLFEDSSDGIVLCDLNGVIIECNNSFEKLCGFNKDILTNQIFYNLISSKSQEGEFKLALRKILKTTDSTKLKSELIKKDGAATLIELRAYLIKDFKSNPVGYYLSIKDLKETDKDEKIHDNSSYENLFLEISNRFISLPLEKIDKNIEFTLSELCKFLKADAGYLFEFNDDKSLFSLSHLWQNENIIADKNCLHNQMIDKLPWWRGQLVQGNVVTVPPVKNLRSDDTVEDGLLHPQCIRSSVYIPITDQKEVLGFIAIYSKQENRKWLEDEITLSKVVGRMFFSVLQRAKRESVLMKNEERFRTLINSTSAGIYIVQDEKIIFANSIMEKVIGYSVEELSKINVFRLIHEDYKELVKEKLKNKLSGKDDGKSYEIKVFNANGEIYWIEVSSAATEFQGKKSIIGTAVDITSKKQAKERLKESHQKYKALYEISQNVLESERRRLAKELHDGVGQKLTFTKINLELFLESDKSDKSQLQPALENIITIGQDIKSVLKSLTPSEIEKYSLDDALEVLVEELKRTTDLKINLHRRCLAEVNDKKLELEIYRIFQEALNNAVKHSGSIQIDVGLNIFKERITCFIKDYGKGFDISELETKSLGLGLMNMKERAEFLGSKLHIDSKNGKGTKISLEVKK